MKAWLPAAMILVISVGWAADAPPLPGDPTRPPEGVIGADGSVAPTVSGLTSVLLPKKGRPAAIIDGQLVQVGGTVRNATLVRVTENSAVLEGGEGTERLFLTPDAEKKTNTTRAAPRRERE